MIISIIVAMGSNRVIGYQNKLPWHIPGDLKLFKKLTLGKPIIMGRKTFESIGRPLPGRVNIVITRNKAWTAEGVDVFYTLEDAILSLKNTDTDEIMVIGGAEIYKEALSQTNKLYVSEIDLKPKGDAFFPLIPNDFKEISRDIQSMEGQDPTWSLVVYEKINH